MPKVPSVETSAQGLCPAFHFLPAPGQPGPNAIMLKKCTKDVRKKLKVLDSNPEYKVKMILSTTTAWRFKTSIAVISVMFQRVALKCLNALPPK